MAANPVFEPEYSYLCEAVTRRLGLVLSTNDPDRLIARLGECRRRAGDPRFASLIFRRNPAAPTSEVFIVKGEQKERDNGSE